MAEPRKKILTRLLSEAGAGDGEAAERLWTVVYDELRRLAAGKLARIPPGQTLQPTALVHEAYLRLLGGESVRWDSRAHFFGAAARAMRNILVDRARRKGRDRHGGGRRRIPLDSVTVACGGVDVDLLALDEALQRLEENDPRVHEMILLRFFAGLTIEETARVLGFSTSTVEREWSYAKAWLYREVKGSERPGRGEKEE